MTPKKDVTDKREYVYKLLFIICKHEYVHTNSKIYLHFEHLNLKALLFYFRNITFTKTGRIVRKPDKFQFTESQDSGKMFRKPVPAKKVDKPVEPPADFTTPCTSDDK